MMALRRAHPQLLPFRLQIALQAGEDVPRLCDCLFGSPARSDPSGPPRLLPV
jgi:hypothetical protein